ncbi:MAG: hypothetical protein V3U85_00245 [Hyphomicrobium sp.]
MSTVKTDSLFADVAAESEQTKDVIVPNGETWRIRQFDGAAAHLDDTVVCIVWDPAGTNEIFACTHGDSHMLLDEPVVGNGVKVIRISLQNDTLVPRVMGVRWEAKKVT